MITHSNDCVHEPFYGGDAPCESRTGAWNQPPGSYVGEAEFEYGDDAPWCRIHARAWELAER